MFMHTKNYRASRMVQGGSSARSTYPESGFHGRPPDVLSLIGPQFGHTNSIWAPSSAKLITTKRGTHPSPSSSASTTFRGPDPGWKTEFWMILCLTCTRFSCDHFDGWWSSNGVRMAKLLSFYGYNIGGRPVNSTFRVSWPHRRAILHHPGWPIFFHVHIIMMKSYYILSNLRIMHQLVKKWGW